MVNQKSVVIGFIVALALSLAVGMVIPAYAGYISVFIASILTGYLVNEDIKDGAIHGILVGIFTAVAVILLVMLRSGSSEKIAGLLIVVAVGLIGSYILIGAVGGAIGSLIKSKR